MNIQDIREIMGLTQAQVADELGVPRQEVIDCEENGETYLLLQYISAFPINPQILNDEDVDPFLPSFDQTTQGHRMRLWREENDISAEDMAALLEISEEELAAFESGEGNPLTRRRGEWIEKKTGMNRKWLMYGDGREKGAPRMQEVEKVIRKREGEPKAQRTPAPNKPAGLRIKQARIDAGLSREELADILDLSVSRVTQMESGYVKDKKAEHILSRIAAVSSTPVREDPKAAGIRLREARKEAGLTVKEAAEIVQLKHTTLAHLESGYITSKHADELIAMIREAPRQGDAAAFDPKEAGVRIREERNKAGLSQKELGTILRLPVTRISLIELGNVTEKEAETILRRIHGQPVREIRNHKVKPTEQVLLGSQIRDARGRAGISQKELGGMLNMPQTRVSLIERGKVDEPTGRKILQMLNDLAESQENAAKALPELPPMAEKKKQRRSRRVLMPELGRKVFEARTAAGMSQKQLADLMGVSQGSVSYMEQGRIDEAQAEKVLQMIADAKAQAQES